MFERFASSLGIDNTPDNYQFILDAMYDYTEEQEYIYCQNGQKISNHNKTDDYYKVLEFWTNEVLQNFQKLVKSKKSPVPESPTNNTPIVDVYVYWMTFTIPRDTDHKILVDYINYLVPRVPKILGCYETADEETDNFHAHFIVELTKKYDRSKTPWDKYFKLKYVNKVVQLKNYDISLKKVRYCFMDCKNNLGYFGNYEYWDDLYKEKLGQVIRKNYTPELNPKSQIIKKLN